MEHLADRPEPGGREPAPGHALQLVQDFVNTIDIESDDDAIQTPEMLRDWLVGGDWLAGDESVDGETHARALAIREGLRALGEANNGEALDRARLAALNRAAGRVPMVATLEPTAWALQPATDGTDRYLGRVMSAVISAMADGSWSRMKACRNDPCRWLFYDRSRNRSGTWCSMAVCGSRMKARAYRARQRTGSAGA